MLMLVCLQKDAKQGCYATSWLTARTINNKYSSALWCHSIVWRLLFAFFFGFMNKLEIIQIFPGLCHSWPLDPCFLKSVMWVLQCEYYSVSITLWVLHCEYFFTKMVLHKSMPVNDTCTFSTVLSSAWHKL